MAEYVIFTDAGADLSAQLCARYDIHGIPMNYLLGGNSETFRPEDPQRPQRCAVFYDALRTRADVSTSQITPFTCEEAFLPVLESGRDILYCCFSSGLSSTWQNLQVTAEELRERFPERKLCCVDSRSAAGGQGLFTIQAAVNREKGMSVTDNARWLEEHAMQICHWFIVDDLDFLKRGGRVSPTVAFLGGKLQIKPLLVIGDDGRLVVKEKIRGRKAAMARLVQLYTQHLDFGEAEPIVMVGHAGSPVDGEALADQVRAISPEGTQVILTDLSPIIGAHTGPDMLFICHFGTHR